MTNTTESTLDDIRFLKLAEMYESAFERFVFEISQLYVKNAVARGKIAALIDPREDHPGRIRKELTRLNVLIRPEDEAAIERAALLDILDIERAAREFYLKALEEVHDPKVAELFRALAREESAHARIAEEALAVADQGRGRVLLEHAMRTRILDPDALQRAASGSHRQTPPGGSLWHWPPRPGLAKKDTEEGSLEEKRS